MPKKKKAEVKEELETVEIETTQTTQPTPETVTTELTIETKKEIELSTKEELEAHILNIYSKPTTKSISAMYLAKQTGASIEEVSLAWHRLFDKGKVSFANLARQ